MKKFIKSILLTVISVLLLTAVLAFSASAVDDGNWITAWGTGPTNIGLENYGNIAPYVGQVTSRSVITPTASGSKIRVKLSNYFGTQPVTIYEASIAKSLGGSRVDVAQGALKLLTFNNGDPSVTIPPGMEVYSDPVNFDVTAMKDIAISLFAKDFQEVKTMGLSGGKSYIALGETSQTRTESFALFGHEADIDDQFLAIFDKLGINFDLPLKYSFVSVVPIIASVDVYNTDKEAYSVVVAGDSTVANEFPQYLAEAIAGEGINDIGVVGKAIIGNSLTMDGLGYGSLVFGESLLKRFERDVLNQSGVKYVIVKIGANEIMHPVCSDIQLQYPGLKQPTAQEIINSFKKLFKMCHDNDIKVVAVGITQWKGYTRSFLGQDGNYIRSDLEFLHDWKIAEDVNAWLATTSEHDGYVNYNDISANPSDPLAFLPEYTIDGAHPSDALQKIWAQNFPLSLIGIGTRVGYVRINRDSLTLEAGKTAKLTATVYPINAVNKNIRWSSTNSTVATVDQNGNVKAISNGTCDIIVRSDEGDHSAKCTITVRTPATGVTMTQPTASVYVTKTVNLSATVLPLNATDKTLTWSTSNNKVATVTQSGVVTGVGKGSATIICKTNDGGYTAMCVVSVFPKTEVESIDLNTVSRSMYVGSTYQLSASVTPLEATFKEVKWTSDNTKVATVNETGLVTAVGEGTANITCKSVDNPGVSERCKVTCSVQTKGVSLNFTSLDLYETMTKMLVATITPENATNKAVTWSSSDPTVASVNIDGVVSANSSGTAVITCTTKDSGLIARCDVTVKKTVISSSVKLDSKNLEITDGKTKKLTATIKPDDVSIKTCKWKSSNKKVAKVDSKGNVTAIAPGKCVITCTTKDSGLTAKCNVTVKAAKVKSVSLNKTSVSIYNGDVCQLTATLNPENATNKNVSWTTSNKNIAKVSSTGKVKATGAGTATITCITEDGKKVATCTIKVKSPKIRSLAVSQATVNLGLNSTYKIAVIPTPSTASTKKLKYQSSNSKVAKVNSSGVVTAVGEGTAIITIYPNDGGDGKGTLVVIKVEKKSVESVDLDKKVLTLTAGKTAVLNASISPSDATNKKIKWESSNTSIATVDKNGKVTAKSKGSCAVVAISEDTGVKSSCTVWVLA